jgi:hypothetical protein
MAVPCCLLIAAAFLSSPAPASLTAQNMQDEQPLDWREELRQIDAEIKEAEDLKNRYLAAARRAEDEGMRWQFMQNQKQEAKRAFQRADDKKEAARMLQARIDVLKARREQILQEHPEANDVQRSS